MLDAIEDLSNYSFKLGIANKATIVNLNDEESATAADFLHMLEDGSPLHDIVASRPIEKTWLTMQNDIKEAYDDCIKMTIDEKKRIDIDRRMIELSQRLRIRLQFFVKSQLKSLVSCHVFYKGRKID